MNLRNDRWRIKCGVQGVNPPPIASWQSLTGGEIEITDTKTHPGGGEDEISLGGPRSRSDATVTRLDSTAIHPYKYQWENSTNQPMWISYQPLDGGPIYTIHGLLKGVHYSEKDADNAGKATISLVMSCQAQISVSAS